MCLNKFLVDFLMIMLFLRLNVFWVNFVFYNKLISILYYVLYCKVESKVFI